MSFGERLREARTKKGLSQKDLGNLIGVGSTAISNYESNASAPKESVLLKLFDVLGVEPNYLFADSFNQKTPPALMQEVSGAELDLLDAFRELNPVVQISVLHLLEALADDVQPSEDQESAEAELLYRAAQRAQG